MHANQMQAFTTAQREEQREEAPTTPLQPKPACHKSNLDLVGVWVLPMLFVNFFVRPWWQFFGRFPRRAHDLLVHSKYYIAVKKQDKTERKSTRATSTDFPTIPHCFFRRKFVTRLYAATTICNSDIEQCKSVSQEQSSKNHWI